MTLSKNSKDVLIGGVTVIPLLVLVVEVVSDQLGINLDPQIAGEGNSEEKPQPSGRYLISAVETLVDDDYLMWAK